MASLDNFLIVESSSLLYTKDIPICLKLVYFNLNALDMILFLSFSDSRHVTFTYIIYNYVKNQYVI